MGNLGVWLKCISQKAAGDCPLQTGRGPELMCVCGPVAELLTCDGREPPSQPCHPTCGSLKKALEGKERLLGHLVPSDSILCMRGLPRLPGARSPSEPSVPMPPPHTLPNTSSRSSPYVWSRPCFFRSQRAAQNLKTPHLLGIFFFKLSSHCVLHNVCKVHRRDPEDPILTF